MIQRIQTVYYAIAISLLVWISLGQEIVSFDLSAEGYTENVHLTVNSFGIDANATLDLTTEEVKAFEKHITETGAVFSMEEQQLSWKNTIPVYILFSVIALLTLIAILSYKNQKRQLRLGRIAFFLNLLVTAGLFVLIMMIPSSLQETATQFMYADTIEAKRSLGLGFYLLCASIPFIFLGNLGVRKDLDLLKSLDRLR